MDIKLYQKNTVPKQIFSERIFGHRKKFSNFLLFFPILFQKAEQPLSWTNQPLTKPKVPLHPKKKLFRPKIIKPPHSLPPFPSGSKQYGLYGLALYLQF